MNSFHLFQKSPAVKMPSKRRNSEKNTDISTEDKNLSPGPCENDSTATEEVTKKRVRISKKEIPEYKWTNEGVRKLADFIKENPQLYDKRQKDWLNVDFKSQLWTNAGKQQDPPATGDQCKKLYENMRTRVGKIMKTEKKSGAGQLERTVRDQEIMDTWSFLTQHIVRGKTVPSEQVSLVVIILY